MIIRSDLDHWLGCCNLHTVVSIKNILEYKTESPAYTLRLTPLWIGRTNTGSLEQFPVLKRRDSSLAWFGKINLHLAAIARISFGLLTREHLE